MSSVLPCPPAGAVEWLAAVLERAAREAALVNVQQPAPFVVGFVVAATQRAPDEQGRLLMRCLGGSCNTPARRLLEEGGAE